MRWDRILSISFSHYCFGPELVTSDFARITNLGRSRKLFTNEDSWHARFVGNGSMQEPGTGLSSISCLLYGNSTRSPPERVAKAGMMGAAE